MRKALLLLGLLLPRLALATLALDTTAHPSGAMIVTHLNGSAGSTQAATNGATSIVSPTFSTAGTNRLIVALVALTPGGNALTASWPITVTGGSLTWTEQRRDPWVSPYANLGGASIWTAFASSTLTSVAVTATRSGTPPFSSNDRIQGVIAVLAITGASSTVGAVNGLVNVADPPASGSTLAVAVTPSSTGSWVVGIGGNDNSNAALTANTTTSAFDDHYEAPANDAFFLGRYRVSGSVATTTAGSAVTVGTTNSDNYVFASAIEIQDASAGSGDVTFSLGAATGSGAVASVTVTGDASVSLGSVAGTGAVASVTASGDASTSLSGVSGAGTVGSVTVQGDASLSLSGVTGDGVVGSVAVQGDTSVSLSGVTGSGVVGSVTVTGDANVTPTGVTGAGVVASQSVFTSPYVFPLSAHSSGHYLVDTNGVPFRIHGDSAWEACTDLDLTDLRQYLDNRRAKGFNTIIVQAANPVKYSAGSHAPAAKGASDALPFLLNTSGGTWDGDPGFRDNLIGGGGTAHFDADFSSPNDVYWRWIETVVDEANARQMVVLLAPMYLGFNNGATDGWYQTVLNSANTTTVMTGFGTYLANGHGVFGGLKNKPNIIWVEGGDMFPSSGSTGETRAHKVLEGLQAAGANQLQTGHWVHDFLSTDQAAFASAMGLESVYTHGVYPTIGPTYARARQGFSHTPALPAYLIETTYEGEHSATAAQIREDMWGGVLSAVGGAVFGNNPIWDFDTGWQTALDATGSLDMQRMAGLLDSLPWWRMVPSGLTSGAFTQATLVTAGGGTFTTMASPGDGESGGDNWVVATGTQLGDYLLAYVPDTHTGTVTIDMSVMSGSTRARWWDPTDGTFTAIATGLSNSGTHAFTTPGTNTGGASDWVLVLDSADVVVALTGVSGAGTVGSLSATGDANVSMSGVAGAGAVASVSVSGDATIALGGVSGSGDVAAVTATGDASVALSGVTGDGVVASLGVSTGGDVTFSLGSVTGAGTVGTLTPTGDSTVTLGAVTGDGTVGTLGVVGDALVALGVVTGDGVVASMTVTADGTVALTGVSGDGTVGTLDVTTSSGGDVTFSLGGVAATGDVGSLSVTGDASVALGSVSGLGTVGTMVASGVPPAVALTVAIPVDPFPIELPQDEAFVRPFAWTFPLGDAPSARLSLTAGNVAGSLVGYSGTVRATIDGVLVTEPGDLESGSKSMAVTMLPDLAATPGTWKASATLTSPTGAVTTRTGTLVIQERGRYWDLSVAAGATPIARAVVTLAGKRQSLAGGACELVGTRGAATFHRSGMLSENDTACLVTLQASDTATAGTWDAALVVTHPTWPGPRSSLGRLVVRSHP
jgi:hypothetical protein